ncbi:GNAT family N-acetyltransferase [Streptomyces bathyalis]|nr:GNAT family N-acetyltransferase [Streptomyces bathyalis]
MPVREMTADDIDAVAELRVCAWQHAYADLLPRPFLDAMSVEEDAARRREMFAQAATLTRNPVTNLVTESAEGAVTGWAAFGPNRPGGAHTSAPRAETATEEAELYAIYVRPDLLGTGLGRDLAGACLEGAARQGFTRVVLWVIEGNARARRFYERAGFTPDGGEDTYDIDGQGTHIPIVRYGRPLTVTDSCSV